MELFYRKTGNGPHLLLLHGLFGMSDNWISLARRYAENFTVWIPDMRNHGQSPHVPGMSYPEMAEDIARFMETHEIRRAGVIGHSMGGKTAILLALAHPYLISRLVIADIGLGATPGETTHLNIINSMTRIQPGRYSRRYDIQKELEKEGLPPDLLGLALKNLGRSPQGTYFWKPGLEEIRKGMNSLAGSLHPTGYFTQPVLLLKGENSNYVSTDEAEALLMFFPLLREEEIADAGHWLHAEQPDAFYHKTMEFLTS